MDLRWVRRADNQRADDLSNEDFSHFDLERRIEVDLDKLDFKVLREMLKAGEELYADLEAGKVARRLEGPAPAPKAKKRKRLKEREPW